MITVIRGLVFVGIDVAEEVYFRCFVNIIGLVDEFKLGEEFKQVRVILDKLFHREVQGLK